MQNRMDTALYPVHPIIRRILVQTAPLLV